MFAHSLTRFHREKAAVPLAFLATSTLFAEHERLDETMTSTQCEQASQSRSNKPPSFYGQCPKRQIFLPKVPYPAWDYNWDGRMTTSSTFETVNTLHGYQASKKLGPTRHIILVRHGQYDMSQPEDDSKCKLTALGRLQALRTGQRLALLTQQLNDLVTTDGKTASPIHISTIYRSNMSRAKETAQIIASQLPNATLSDPDSLLNEGLPAPMIPARPDVQNAENEIDKDRSRIEEAFQKYFYRISDADNSSNRQELPHTFEVVVAHANVIRYFFCRALQLPPEAWLRMSIFNCSLTYIMVHPNGYVTVRMLGDTGHIPYHETTFSNNFGWNWS
jgi:serine/threonine-protein phosphatase PGAM5